MLLLALDPRVELALNETGNYLPCEVSRILCAEYSFNLPETQDRDITLRIAFEASQQDKAVFTALDHGGTETLAQFRLSFAGAVGTRDWQYYLLNKHDGGTVRDYNGDCAVRNLHDVMAKKLQGALQRRGLMHVYTGAANVEDVPDIRIERQLIGIALDHREMHANPATIVRRLAQI